VRTRSILILRAAAESGTWPPLGRRASLRAVRNRTYDEAPSPEIPGGGACISSSMYVPPAGFEPALSPPEGLRPDWLHGPYELLKHEPRSSADGELWQGFGRPRLRAVAVAGRPAE
jgi:hypothetical protein